MKTTEEIGSGFGNGASFEALCHDILRRLRWVYDKLGELDARHRAASLQAAT